MLVFRSASLFGKTDSGVFWFPWGYKANTKGSNNRLVDLKRNVFIFGQTYSAGLKTVCSVKKNILFKVPNHLWVVDLVAGVKKLDVSQHQTTFWWCYKGRMLWHHKSLFHVSYLSKNAWNFGTDTRHWKTTNGIIGIKTSAQPTMTHKPSSRLQDEV